MLYWRLAFRNLLRHRLRLILNLILLVGGFLTIICFKGFKTHVLETIQNIVIDTQYAHLQVAKQSFWDNSSVDQVTDKMIGNSAELVQKISTIEGVHAVSSRVGFFGLVNTEDHQSTTAHFIGVEPEIENKLQKSFLFVEGQKFEQSSQAILSQGLQTKLKIKSGAEVTVVSPTLSGGMNGMDLQVRGIFSTGFADVDQGTVFLTLNDAQRVLDSPYVDQLLITVKDESQIPQVILKIRELLRGTDLQVKAWTELAELYNQVENFYSFQNLFIEAIILLQLFLSVANTFSMNVFERLGEIGTLRALGDYESDIRRIFLIEAILLGLFAICVGLPVSIILVKFVSSLEIQLVLPLASQPMPFKLIPSFGAYLEASLICLFSVVVASLWPARKGAKISIVTALGARI